MRRPDSPLTYRIEHRFGDACQVLEQAPDYETAVERVRPLAVSLRALGAEGELALVEEAFGTIVALHPIWPAEAPVDAVHEWPDASSS